MASGSKIEQFEWTMEMLLTIVGRNFVWPKLNEICTQLGLRKTTERAFKNIIAKLDQK